MFPQMNSCTISQLFPDLLSLVNRNVFLFLLSSHRQINVTGTNLNGIHFPRVRLTFRGTEDHVEKVRYCWLVIRRWNLLGSICSKIGWLHTTLDEPNCPKTVLNKCLLLSIVGPNVSNEGFLPEMLKFCLYLLQASSRKGGYFALTIPGFDSFNLKEQYIQLYMYVCFVRMDQSYKS